MSTIKDAEISTVYHEFCGWYKCSNCGVNEHFIPSKCPVCGKLVENYQKNQTDRLREVMIGRREEDED